MKQLLFKALSPFDFDIFCVYKKFLIFNLVSRHIKVKYRKSILGLFWTLLVPAGVAGTYYFVFKIILNVQIPNYLAFIIIGILPWTFFSQTVMECMESIVGNVELITKVPIPIQAFPLSGALTNLTTLILAVPVILGAAILSGAPLGASILLLPIYLFILFMLAYFIGLSLAIIFIYLRDLRHVLTVGMQLWFYASPVLYHERMIPEHLQSLLYLNPVGLLFVGLHQIVLENGWPSKETLLVPFLWVLISMAFTITLYKQLGQKAVEKL
jgi:ABC-type polysaccharide/polyol phosphate export permease